MDEAQMKLEPFRSLDDFILKGRFEAPNILDLDRWANRVIRNLIYYQTNYFLLAIIIYFVVGTMYPIPIVLGTSLVAGLTFLYNLLNTNQRALNDLKKRHAQYLALAIVVGVFLIIALLRCMLMVLFGVAIPFSAILLHASFRLRNSMNKLENIKEKLQFKITPMGWILYKLGMTLNRPNDE